MKIQKDSWIGAWNVIAAGVTIGEGSEIGIHSYVNSDVPDNKFCIGIPARVQKKADREFIPWGRVWNAKNTIFRFILQTGFIVILLAMSFGILIPGYEAFLYLDSLWKVANYL